MRAAPVVPIAGLVVVVVVAAACRGDDRCDPRAEVCVYERTLSELSIAPGEELSGLCQSWTLDNPTELWVGNVTMDNGGAYHHSNWFFVPDDLFAQPDGTWSCRDGGFDELAAAITGGYLFAQSTQVEDESQTFPPGVAVRIPPWSRIVGATHLLNAAPQAVTTHMTLRLETVPTRQLAVKLAPARIEFNALAIDPEAVSSFTTACDLAGTHQTVLRAPLAYRLYYALPHYHELGIAAQLELVGGPRDGEVVFRSVGYGEASGIAFDPPVDLAAAGATGLRYTCTFDNPRAEEVGWGLGDQEMCVVALFADTELGWQGNARQSERVGPAPDGVIEHTGTCEMFGVRWDHDKAGGPPR
jgi:hypothetical protein